ncbi:unnamed protein product [Phytophthora fragariaefolia]|uniref:Unnamed protein product n=1 Tax=Phytophthora fragariaefolia TaxID=1490495 RepID=A0A9W6YJM9_9STRA|nr:unnamed protein product [Phytophthora fragariaefolia]
MVWGAIGYHSKSELVVLEGRQAFHHYIWTFSEHMLPCTLQHYGTEFVFMQDNVSIHASTKTREFFKGINVTLLEWPTRCPDLNPIENVWAILADKDYRHGKQYQSVVELTAAVMKA